MKKQYPALANLVLAAALVTQGKHAAAAQALQTAADDPDFEEMSEDLLTEQAKLRIQANEELLDAATDADTMDPIEGELDEDDEDDTTVLAKALAGSGKAKNKKATAGDDGDEDDEGEGDDEDEGLDNVLASLKRSQARVATAKLSSKALANVRALSGKRR